MNKLMVSFLQSTGLKRMLLLLIFSAGIVQMASAQVEISGTVTDAKNGDPLPGVNVIEKETINGTITDLNGEYTLTVDGSSSVLEFSYVGYETLEVPVNNRSVINVSLSIGVALEEVVVVGYGTQKKESVVGAISQVSGDELVSSGTNNVSTAITGKLSGVATLQTNGKPGEEDPKIYIRGAATWNNTNPLIMVDGIQRSNWSDIDPNEIESVSVLKDASATAVYGAKGGNGVILITTKRGMQSKPQFNFSYSHGFKQMSENAKMMDAYETLTRFNTALKNDNLWSELYSPAALEHYRLQDFPEMYPSVDWVSEMFKIGHSDNVNLNVRGGSEKVDYFVSLGYLFDGDILNLEKQGDFDPRNYYSRYNFRTNLGLKITNTTKLSANISGSVQDRNRPSTMNRGGNSLVWGSIFGSAVNAAPIIYPASVLEEYPDPNEPGAEGERYVYYNNGQLFDSPITMLYSTGFEHEKQLILNSDLILDQDLSMITEGLSAKATASYGSNVGYQRRYGGGAFTLIEPTYRLTVYDDDDYLWQRLPLYYEDIPQMAFSNENQQSLRRNLYYDAQLNYQRTFGGKHYVTSLFVFRRKQLNVGVQEPFKEEAWSGRITYAYKLKYLFETNLGYTGSEQFAPGNRFGFFPAFALGWNIGEEDFIKDNFTLINRMKIRYSYGKVGVDNGSRWLYYQSYTNNDLTGNIDKGTFGAYGVWNPYTNTYVEGSVANSIAQWETAIKHNFGLELGLWNKLDFTLDLFKEERNNILEEPHTVPQFAALQFKDLNLGITKSHGYEIETTYNDKFGSNWRIYLNGKFSFSENRVLFRDDPLGLPDYQKAAGFPISQPRELLSAGRYGSVDDINNYVQPGTNTYAIGEYGYTNLYQYILGDESFVDYNGDGLIDSNDEVAYGFPSYPLYNVSFTANLGYKGFNFRFLLNGQFDKTSSLGDEWSVPFGISYPFLYENQMDYYTSDNPEAFYPAIHTGAFGLNNYKNPVYSLPITSFLRLREVELSYDFKVKNNTSIRNLQVFLNGNNLLTYAPNTKFGDPEKPDVRPARDDSYPLVRRYNVGIKLGF